MKKWYIYALPLPLLILALLVGPTQEFSLWQFANALYYLIFPNPNLSVTEQNNIAMMQNILLYVRMPRVFLTFLVGATLASSGNALQALFRNPLVDSYVLGISAGAAFGASVGLLYDLPVQLLAFIGGVMAVGMTYGFAYQPNGRNSLVVVLLSGMVVSGVCVAGLSIVQYLSDPYKLQAIVQWTMGNLHQATWQKIAQAILPMSVALVGLYVLRWRMNVLALGYLEAKAVGVNPHKDQAMIVFLVTLATSSSVAVAGIVSLYGLFVPHMVRMMVGANHADTIPANICFGGCFLLMIDTLSRTFASFEIPIGIFTMLLGAPIFLYLIRRQHSQWAV